MSNLDVSNINFQARKMGSTTNGSNKKVQSWMTQERFNRLEATLGVVGWVDTILRLFCTTQNLNVCTDVFSNVTIFVPSAKNSSW